MLLVQQEGMMSLWAGLPPALARGFIYGGLRLGLYGPTKALLSTPPSPSAAGGSSDGGTSGVPKLGLVGWVGSHPYVLTMDGFISTSAQGQ